MNYLPILLILATTQSIAGFTRDCSGDPSLANDNQVIHCESWEDNEWYLNGYQNASRIPLCKPGTSGCSFQGSLSNPFDPNSLLVPEDVGHTEIVNRVSDSVPCVSGRCLKVHMLEGSHGSLKAKWQLADANLQPQELYFSYYIYLSDNWEAKWPGGKFPGLADVRIPNVDAVGQCGNGGYPGDGINCWAMRTHFAPCNAGGVNSCVDLGKPNASTRIGSYIDIFGNDVLHGNYAIPSFWDSHKWDRLSVPANTTCASSPFNDRCAKNDLSMLENGKWYQVEMYVKMNTPLEKAPSYTKEGVVSFYDGKGDGIIRGWVNGQLAYEKTNVIFRLIGHDNLHAKTAWLNVFMGGSTTNPRDQAVYLDQMVVSTRRIGPRNQIMDLIPPKPPTNLIAN